MRETETYYDPKTLELAQYYGSETPLDEEQVKRLAREIQLTIEDFVFNEKP